MGEKRVSAAKPRDWPEGGGPAYDSLTEQLAHQLHEAICDGRRQDAIDLLNELDLGQRRFPSVAEQHRATPGRVAAPTPADRAR